MKILNHKINNVVFIISFLYVGMGTIGLLMAYPGNPLGIVYSEWQALSEVLMFLGYPVIIISFGYGFAQGYPLWPVFIIQTIMFVLMYIVVYLIIASKKR